MDKRNPFERALPHACGDALLLLAHGIRVDRRGGELSVPQPFLHHVKGDAPADGLDAEAVPQALRTGMGPVWDVRRCYDLLHPPEGCHATPRPKQRLRLTAPLR